jgi:hypothetical protein
MIGGIAGTPLACEMVSPVPPSAQLYTPQGTSSAFDHMVLHLLCLASTHVASLRSFLQLNHQLLHSQWVMEVSKWAL